MKKTLTTDSVTEEIFCPHGRLEFTSKESIIHIDAIGPFNQEVIEAVGRIEPKMLHEITKKYGSWSEIIVYQNSCVYSPEGLLALEKYINQLSMNKIAPKKSAFVISEDVEGQGMMGFIYSALYKRCAINMCVFKNEQEALIWLGQKD